MKFKKITETKIDLQIPSGDGVPQSSLCNDLTEPIDCGNLDCEDCVYYKDNFLMIIKYLREQEALDSE